jgi:hypothetical protein
MYNELLFLTIGFCIGVAFMLNRKEYLEQKTYEELDEELRKDLTYYRNLSDSLKRDLSDTKQQLIQERQRK